MNFLKLYSSAGFTVYSVLEQISAYSCSAVYCNSSFNLAGVMLMDDVISWHFILR